MHLIETLFSTLRIFHWASEPGPSRTEIRCFAYVTLYSSDLLIKWTISLLVFDETGLKFRKVTFSYNYNSISRCTATLWLAVEIIRKFGHPVVSLWKIIPTRGYGYPVRSARTYRSQCKPGASRQRAAAMQTARRDYFPKKDTFRTWECFHQFSQWKSKQDEYYTSSWNVLNSLNDTPRGCPTWRNVRH